MGCQAEVTLGDNLTFSICTHDPDTGALTDADAAPAYRVYEDETATAILTGTMAKLDDANTTGFYTELIACTAANGFESSKTYTIYISATVDSDTGGISYGFRAKDEIRHKNSSKTYDASTDSLEAIRDTLSSSTVTVVSAVSGSTVTVVPYTTWEFTIDGLADLSGAKANGVFFTVKENYTDADSAAILQVQEGVGLLYINGVAGTAAKATLTVGAGEDEITVHVNASQTGIAEKRALVWDIKQVITDDEDADQMATGTFHIADEAVTRDLAV